MRDAFAASITELAAADERVCLLVGDLGNHLWDTFRERFPDRWYNAGIAEQNMVSVAAGLALAGMKPFVYSIASFAVFRCYEQIRVDVCYHDLPVVIVGVGAGLSYAKLGPTHHACEDIAVMRTLPGMTVWCPCDPLTVRDCVGMSGSIDGPLYLRLGKNGEPNLPQMADVPRKLDVRIYAAGPIAKEAFDAADLLRCRGVKAYAEPWCSVKPLNEERLREEAKTCRLVATVEEHSVVGGFGEAVWAAIGGRVRMLSFAVPDSFLHNVGGREEALAACGLTAEKIAGKILEAIR